MRNLAAGMALTGVVCGQVNAQDGPAVTVSGEARFRYETLSGQFRAGQEGGDQALATRFLVKLEADAGPARFVFEAIDARTMLDDAGSPKSTSFVNAADILQAHAVFDLGGRLGQGSQTHITLGRFTLDLGSRRLAGRNGFRNTINSFNGLHAIWSRGDTTLTAFYTAPTQILPRDGQALQDNAQDYDEILDRRRFFGLYGRRENTIFRAAAEAYVVGFREADTDKAPSTDRELFTPGVRLIRTPQTGRYDFELESAVQFGTRRASTAPNATPLDVRAHTHHAHIGYSFDHAWSPRVAAEFEYASGDDDPNDTGFERFDPLFGLRRTDFGQTGISGPLRRVNAASPGVRLTVKRGPLDGRLVYKAAFLASDTDIWAGTGVRDPEGQSGALIGHHVDTRWRYWIKPGRVRAELGGAVFFDGPFARTAPNATREGDTVYAYGMMTIGF